MKKSEYSLQEKRDFARDMRRNMTRAEQALWWKLSHNQSGYRFCRQSLLQGYIVDFYCASLRLVIEVDGSVHDDENIGADDEQRERALEACGFLVLRFRNEDVLDHMTVVLTRLWDECAARRNGLKALDGKVLGGGKRKPEALNSTCASVENSRSSATVGKLSVDAPPRIPATPEDIKAINEAFKDLVRLSRERAKVLQFGSPLSDNRANLWWRKRRAELKQQAEAAKRLCLEAAGQLALPIFGDGTPRKLMETEPQTLALKGFDLEEQA
jgi:very-short-patch-repair endonuclease